MRVSPSSPSSPAISLEEVVGDEDRRDQDEPLLLGEGGDDLAWNHCSHLAFGGCAFVSGGEFLEVLGGRRRLLDMGLPVKDDGLDAGAHDSTGQFLNVLSAMSKDDGWDIGKILLRLIATAEAAAPSRCASPTQIRVTLPSTGLFRG